MTRVDTVPDHYYCRGAKNWSGRSSRDMDLVKNGKNKLS